MSSIIQFLKIRKVKSPERAHLTDAGIDFYVPELNMDFIKLLQEKNPTIYITKEGIILYPQQRILIPSGIHCQMQNYDRCLIAFNKSGIASKLGLIVGSCVVDSDYQGEIHLSLINTSNKPIKITSGMKILQFIEIPIFNSHIIMEERKTLGEFYKKETTRGNKGFGSTDKK